MGLCFVKRKGGCCIVKELRACYLLQKAPIWKRPAASTYLPSWFPFFSESGPMVRCGNSGAASHHQQKNTRTLICRNPHTCPRQSMVPVPPKYLSKTKDGIWGSPLVCHCPIFFPDSEALEGSQPSLREVACPDYPACGGWSWASDWFISCQDQGSHLCLTPSSRLKWPFVQNDTFWPIWVVTWRDYFIPENNRF